MFKQKKKKNDSKLVKRYIHTSGFSNISGRAPEKKNPHFLRNRILLIMILLVFALPGLYFSFC